MRPSSVDASQALVEPRVTPDNQQLFRTYHQGLSDTAGVWFVKERSGRHIWVVALGPTFDVPWTYAGDLEIHTSPTSRTIRADDNDPPCTGGPHFMPPQPPAVPFSGTSKYHMGNFLHSH